MPISIARIFEITYDPDGNHYQPWFIHNDQDSTEFSTSGEVSRIWDHQHHHFNLLIFKFSKRFLSGRLRLLRFVFAPPLLAIIYFVVHPVLILLGPFLFAFKDAKRASIPFDLDLFTKCSLNGGFRLTGAYYAWKRQRMKNQLSKSKALFQRLALVPSRKDFLNQYRLGPEDLKDEMIKQLLEQDDFWTFEFKYLSNFTNIMSYSSEENKEKLVDRLLATLSIHNNYCLVEVMKVSSESCKERLIDYLLSQEGEWQRLLRSTSCLVEVMKVSSESCKERLIDYLLSQDGQWRLLVPYTAHFSRIYKVAPEQSKQQMFERLLTQEGEWERLVKEGYNFVSVMEVVPAGMQQQMIDRLLTQEGEWARLVNTNAYQGYNNVHTIMKFSSEAYRHRMIDRLAQKGQLEKFSYYGRNAVYNLREILRYSSCFMGAKLIHCLIEDSAVPHRRGLDDLSTIKFYTDSVGIYGNPSLIGTNRNPLESLQECTDIEEFKRKLDKLIQVPELKRLGRLFGQAIRSQDQCHLGRMPLEILQCIGSFAAPCLANQDVNSIISAHLDKPKIESREASGSAAVATM